MSWTVADLTFDRDAHRTYAPDGSEVPHVTTILEATRVSAEFGELSSRNPRAAEDLAAARARGTAVHADCHAYDDDDLDLDRVDYRVAPYLECWIACRADKGLRPLRRERRLYHPAYGYTGIEDGLFVWESPAGPVKVRADIKTGDPDDAAAHLQTAAYEAAASYENPENASDLRWAIQLTPGHRHPYRIVDYTARPEADLDFMKFVACLTVYHEQFARRRRIR